MLQHQCEVLARKGGEMTEKEKKKQITISVSPAELGRLQLLSDRTLAPVGALIRAAITNYLELRKAEIKEK